MTAPCYTLEGLLKARRVAHAGHPILRWNVSNVEVKRDEAGRLRPVKPRVTGSHRKRIDGVVALLMGLSVLGRQAAGRAGAAIFHTHFWRRLSRAGWRMAVTVEAWQRDVLRELRQIRHLLEQRRRPSALSREDREMLKRILPVLGATFGGDTFSSRDAIESEASGLRLVLRGVSVKQLGKLLARAVDVLIDGLMVRKQGVECHVTAWQIVGSGSL